MRETNFIKQKKEKWIELEKTIQQNNPEPEKLNDLFVQVTDDLSYSRTFYPNRSVRVYLNSLAQQIFYSIYKNNKHNKRNLLSFWTKELPIIMYRSRKELLTAMLLFWIPFLIGCLSGAIGESEAFARQLLGNEYIDMTLGNISAGDPMAVYKDKSRVTMFLMIFFNNLLVCLRFFVFGVLFAVGSIFELVFFGLYVGAFQYFFYEQGELLASVLGVWTHGSIEIPAAILSGFAGMVMGKGLVFPKTYTRLQAFLITARKGLKIIVGTFPLILMAAFIESYITRLTGTPDILRASFIVFNLLIVLLYFVIYPYWLGTTNFKMHLPKVLGGTLLLSAVLLFVLLILKISSVVIITLMAIPIFAYVALLYFDFTKCFIDKPYEEVEEKLQANKENKIDFQTIKSFGGILKDTFLMCKKYFSKMMIMAVCTAVFFISFVLLFAEGKFTELFGTEGDWVVGNFFNYTGQMIAPHFVANNIIYTIIIYASLITLQKTFIQNTSDFSIKRNQILILLKIAALVLFLNTQIWLGCNNNSFFIFTCCLSLPFSMLWMVVIVIESNSFVQSFLRTWQLMFTKWTNFLVLNFVVGLITIMVLALLYSPILMFVFRNIGYNILTTQEGIDEILLLMIAFVTQTIYATLLPFLIMNIGFYYFSQVEIRDAKQLMKSIQLIGTTKRIRGLEREG